MQRPLELFLRRLLLRNTLSQADIDALLSIDAPLSTIPARQDLVVPDQHVDFACLVQAGLVGRSDWLANGERRATAIYLPGDMCDLHSVAFPVAGWGITALSECAIFRVPHAQLEELFHRRPAIGMAIWRDTVVDASILSKWVSMLGGSSARQRFAHLLCEVGLRLETMDRGSRDRFDLAMTQDQLAELLGITTVHLNRTFQQMREEGLISGGRGRSNRFDAQIEVRDWKQLAAVAEFDDSYLLLGRRDR